MILSPTATVHCPGDSRVHRTALAELALVLGLPGPGALRRVPRADGAAVHLALLEESEPIRELCRIGRIGLADTDPAGDGFAVARAGRTLCLAGRTPRGLLQSVYELQETLAERSRVPPDILREGVFRIPLRVFHPRFDGWPGSRADVRFIGRLGASHCLVSHDWQGDRRSLQGYVTSPLFPDAVPSGRVAANRAGLRALLDDCTDHGLESALWLTELPCQGGPWVAEADRRAFLARYPAECLSDSGTYEGKVLCFGHPRIRTFYRDLLRRFFREFPEISLLFVFGLDSGGEFCDPSSCPRCRGLSRMDQRDRFLRFLLEEGRAARPGLRVLTTNWGWDRDPAAFLRAQARLPSGVGLYCAAQRDGWQCERQAHDILRAARGVCRKRGQLFLGYDDLQWGDDTVHGLRDIQDYPFGVAAKLRRWHDLGADGVFDHWGTWPEDAGTNAASCRAFLQRPHADPLPVCRDLAVRRFGRAAAPHVLEAWGALEAAHAALSPACTWSPLQWPGWYRGRSEHPIPGAMEAQLEKLSQRAESPKPSGTFVYNGGDLAARLQAVSDAWRSAWPRYREAAAAMRRAVRAADGTPVDRAHWWIGRGEAPKRRDHLRRQLLYIEANGVVGREIGLHFGLLALYEREGRDADRWLRASSPLLREDAAACLAAARFLARLSLPPGSPVRAWPALYRAKAKALAP